MTTTYFIRQFPALFILAVVAALLFTGAARAEITAEAGDEIKVSGERDDMSFFAGGDLLLSIVSVDDIIVAGGNVKITETSGDHLIAAGGNLEAEGIEVDDLILTGGNVSVRASTIRDDVIVAGGSVSLAADTAVGGSAVMTGGDVTIHAPIGAELYASGGSITLTSSVGGNAWLAGDSVFIGPDVIIGGDLTVQVVELEIDPAATITGDLIELEAEAEPEPFTLEAVIAALVASFLFVAGFGLLSLAIVALLPGLMKKASGMIGSSALTCLGVGLLTVFALPIVATVLMVTIVGIPLGVTVLAFLITLLPFAFTAFIYFASLKLRALFVKSQGEPDLPGRLLWTGIGWAILWVISIIPFIGWLIWFIVMLLGTGAVIMQGGKALAQE